MTNDIVNLAPTLSMGSTPSPVHSMDEEASARKRRRSIRIKRRSLLDVIPLVPDNIENTISQPAHTEDEDICDLPIIKSQENDENTKDNGYGSIWMETNSPTVSKIKCGRRRSRKLTDLPIIPVTSFSSHDNDENRLSIELLRTQDKYEDQEPIDGATRLVSYPVDVSLTQQSYKENLVNRKSTSPSWECGKDFSTVFDDPVKQRTNEREDMVLNKKTCSYFSPNHSGHSDGISDCSLLSSRSLSPCYDSLVCNNTGKLKYTSPDLRYGAFQKEKYFASPVNTPDATGLPETTSDLTPYSPSQPVLSDISPQTPCQNFDVPCSSVYCTPVAGLSESPQELRIASSEITGENTYTNIWGTYTKMAKNEGSAVKSAKKSVAKSRRKSARKSIDTAVLSPKSNQRQARGFISLCKVFAEKLVNVVRTSPDQATVQPVKKAVDSHDTLRNLDIDLQQLDDTDVQSETVSENKVLSFKTNSEISDEDSVKSTISAKSDKNVEISDEICNKKISPDKITVSRLTEKNARKKGDSIPRVSAELDDHSVEKDNSASLNANSDDHVGFQTDDKLSDESKNNSVSLQVCLNKSTTAVDVNMGEIDEQRLANEYSAVDGYHNIDNVNHVQDGEENVLHVPSENSQSKSQRGGSVDLPKESASTKLENTQVVSDSVQQSAISSIGEECAEAIPSQLVKKRRGRPRKSVDASQIKSICKSEQMSQNRISSVKTCTEGLNGAVDVLDSALDKVVHTIIVENGNPLPKDDVCNSDTLIKQRKINDNESGIGSLPDIDTETGHTHLLPELKAKKRGRKLRKSVGTISLEPVNETQDCQACVIDENEVINFNTFVTKKRKGRPRKSLGEVRNVRSSDSDGKECSVKENTNIGDINLVSCSEVDVNKSAPDSQECGTVASRDKSVIELSSKVLQELDEYLGITSYGTTVEPTKTKRKRKSIGVSKQDVLSDDANGNSDVVLQSVDSDTGQGDLSEAMDTAVRKKRERHSRKCSEPQPEVCDESIERQQMLGVNNEDNETLSSSRKLTRLRRRSGEIYKQFQTKNLTEEGSSPVVEGECVDSVAGETNVLQMQDHNNVLSHSNFTNAPSRKQKRKKGEECLEDIYRNKNFKRPEAKMWETIYEDPMTTKNPEQLFGKKRMRRAIAFDSLAPAKARRRIQRAVKMGWDPRQRKKLSLSHEATEEKISKMKQELEEFERSFK